MVRNVYYQTLIQGTNRSFNPLFFVLLPDAARAIQRRDQWLKSSWPFFYERVVPCEGADQLKLERCESQQLMQDGVNRLLGCFDCRRGGDEVAGESHTMDAVLTLMNGAATIKTRRTARKENNDVLLRRRESIAAGAGVRDMKYSLGKREQAQEDFFRKGGAGRQSGPQSGTYYGAFAPQSAYTQQLPLHSTPTFSQSFPANQFGQDLNQQYLQTPFQQSTTTISPSPFLNSFGGFPAQPFAPRGRGWRRWNRGFGRGAQGAFSNAQQTAGTGRGAGQWPQQFFPRGNRGAFRGGLRGRGQWVDGTLAIQPLVRSGSPLLKTQG
jgi:hypothetical protein